MGWAAVMFVCRLVKSPVWPARACGKAIFNEIFGFTELSSDRRETFSEAYRKRQANFAIITSENGTLPTLKPDNLSPMRGQVTTRSSKVPLQFEDVKDS